MKKLLALIICLSCIYTLTHAADIKGQLICRSGSVPEFLLLRSYANPAQTDSVQVGVYGNFVLHTSTVFPVLYSLVYGNNGFPFFIHPLETDARILLTFENGYLQSGEVFDSHENSAFNALQNLMNINDEKLIALLDSSENENSLKEFLADYNKALLSFQQTYKGTYTANTLAAMRIVNLNTTAPSVKQSLQQIFFGQVNFADTSILANPLYTNMVNFYIAKLCNTTSEFKWFIEWLMKQSAQNNKVYKHTANLLYSQLSTSKNEEKLIAFMEWFQQYANKELLPVLNARITRLSRIMPGQKFIELTGLNTTGKTESLTKIVAANKLTLLLIWESTCSHCREEIPLIKKQYDTYKSKGLQIYAVSLDENESNWKKFLEDNNISWINIRLNNASEELNSYVPNQTPVIVMINQQGVIQHRLFNANDLSKHLKSFFSE